MATYKNIVSLAIADFNAIQGQIAAKGDVPNLDPTDSGTFQYVPAVTAGNAATIMATQYLSDEIRDYLAFPTGTLTLSDTNIGAKKADGKYEVRVAKAVVAGSNRNQAYELVSIPAATRSTTATTLIVGTSGWVEKDTELFSTEAGTLGDLSATEVGDTLKISGGVTKAGYLTTSAVHEYTVAAATYTAATLSGDPVTPTLAKVTTTTNAGGNITVATGGAKAGGVSALTKTAPASGYYVAIGSSATSGTLSGNGVVATAGYAKQNQSTGTATGTLTINASGNYYVPIDAASLSKPTATVGTAPAVTADSSINANIATATTDTWNTGLSIKATSSVTTNGSVNTSATVSAGYTPGATVAGDALTVTPTANDEADTNYITKIKIADGKTFGNSTTAALDVVGSVYMSTPTASKGNLYYSGKQVIKNGALAPATITGPTAATTVDSVSVTANGGTTITLEGTVGTQPSVTTEGWISSSIGTKTASTMKVSMSASDDKLLAKNIRSGVTIFGVTGTYLAPSVDSSVDTNTGTELRYISVSSDSHGTNAHLHSSDMLYGAVAYVDDKPVYGIMNDYSVASNATNTYGATGAGLTLPVDTIALSGTTLTAKVNGTGYVKDGVTGISLTVPTEAKTNQTITSNTFNFTPTAGKLLTGVSGTVQAWNGSANAAVEITSVTTAQTRTNNSGNYGKALNWNEGASGQPTTYVTIAATGSGGVTTTQAGWLGENKSNTSATDTNRIAADTTSEKTVAPGTLTGSVSDATIGGETQFSNTGANIGEITSVGAKSGTVNATAQVAANTSAGTLSVKDKYMISNVAVKTSAIGSTNLTAGTASIAEGATGSKVDAYLEALYLRMNGKAYNASAADATL